MSLLAWIVKYVIISLIYRWIISWGGAEKIEGWTSYLFFGFFTIDFNNEQLKLLSLILWFLYSIYFILGIFIPDLRI
ncbi:hypothetical protein A7M79_01360 [Acinetobacter baumannii]|nr:hypothetical protein A7M79_01360 [Acinetobacter baumannii]